MGSGAAALTSPAPLEFFSSNSHCWDGVGKEASFST